MLGAIGGDSIGYPGPFFRKRAVMSVSQGSLMLSQTAEYALRAMSCLAVHPDAHHTAASLAEQTQVPADYLSKVLQHLSSAGLIKGRRGVGGGYTLSREPGEINLLQVIDAVSPLQRIRTCPLGLSSHGENLCPLHRTMDSAIAQMQELFSSKTLGDLLNEPGANLPLCEAQSAIRPTVNGR